MESIRVNTLRGGFIFVSDDEDGIWFNVNIPGGNVRMTMTKAQANELIEALQAAMEVERA